MRSVRNILLIFLAIIAISLIYTEHQPLFRYDNRRDNTDIACTMDAKICPDGRAVGGVGPHCEFAPCPDNATTSETLDPLIVIDTPQTGSIITSPVTITGKARGPWFFEASFPISIVNWDGLIIGEGIATAKGDWMTEDFVPFSATISYTTASNTPYARGAIILRKDNPSGLPEHDDAREIEVQFSEVITSDTQSR